MGPGPSNAAPEVIEAFTRPVLGHLDPDELRHFNDLLVKARHLPDEAPG